MIDTIWYPRKNRPGIPDSAVEPDKGKWEWVVFPDVDIFDKPHQPASLNGFKLERGHRYFCPPDVAGEVRRLIDTARRADMRLMQATPDLKSVRESPSQNADATFVRG